MRTKLKIMLVLSLFLLLIGCSKEKDDSQIVKESKVQEEKIQKESVQVKKRISKEAAVVIYLEEGILEGYTETEILIEMFEIFFPNIKEDAEYLKGKGYTYENLDEFMKEFKATPAYSQGVENIVGLGFNREESEMFLNSTTAIYIIYNDYSDKGIYLEEDAAIIIPKDERIQNFLKNMANVTRDTYNRSE